MSLPSPPAPELILPIVDPGLLKASVNYFLLFGLPCLAFSLLLEDLMNKRKAIFTLHRIGVRLGTFIALTALPLYYYPGFHGWYVQTIASQVGTEFWMDLTRYHPLRYGGIHMPTFILMFFFAVAAVATPYVAQLTENSIEAAARWIQKDWRERNAENLIEETT